MSQFSSNLVANSFSFSGEKSIGGSVDVTGSFFETGCGDNVLFFETGFDGASCLSSIVLGLKG